MIGIGTLLYPALDEMNYASTDVEVSQGLLVYGVNEDGSFDCNYWPSQNYKKTVRVSKDRIGVAVFERKEDAIIVRNQKKIEAMILMLERSIVEIKEMVEMIEVKEGDDRPWRTQGTRPG